MCAVRRAVQGGVLIRLHFVCLPQMSHYFPAYCFEFIAFRFLILALGVSLQEFNTTSYAHVLWITHIPFYPHASPLHPHLSSGLRPTPYLSLGLSPNPSLPLGPPYPFSLVLRPPSSWCQRPPCLPRGPRWEPPAPRPASLSTCPSCRLGVRRQEHGAWIPFTICSRYPYHT